MQLCRWILKPIGIWHMIYGRSSQSEKLLSLIMIFVCFFGLCFVLVPAGPYTLFREKDINIKVKLFGPIGFCLTSAIKYCFLGARASSIGRCVEHVESDWRIVRHYDHRRMMLRNVLVGRRLTTLCVIFLYTGGMSYHTIMPLSSRTKTNGSFTSRPLVYPGYDLYFDPQASPAYEIIFGMHCLSAMIQYSATTAACSLAASFATHACGQVQILMTLLDDLVDGKRNKDTNVEKRLRLITKHHVRVLRFTTDVEKILREICLLELVAATLIICLLEYYCMTEWANSDAVAILTYFMLLISLTFNILIFCYIGELLVEEFGKIGSAAYEVNWYDLPGHKAVDLVMIITMSYYPPKLTAGKFCDLSLNTFSTVLKTSVVYLNLLRTSSLYFADSMNYRSSLPDRIHNVRYEHDIYYAIQLCRWILQSIGIWHIIYGRSSQSEKHLSLMLIFMSFFGLCFVLVPAGSYFLFYDEDIESKIKFFGPVTFCLTSVIKYCFLGTRISTIGRCIEHVESDWRVVQYQNHRRMMLKNVLMARRITMLCVIFLYGGGLFYHTILPLSSRTKINGSFANKPLIYPGYDLYFDPQASPAYEIIFGMHCLSAMIQYSATTAVCSLAANFATHARGQVQILMTLLDDLVNGKKTKDINVEKRLSFITKHHVRVLRFTTDVEKILREVCLVELVTATLMICLLEYLFLMEWENSDAVGIMSYMLLFVALTFNVLIFCYIGELFVEEFGKISSAAYEVNWYDLPGHKAVDLIMIMMKSYYPPKLTAGKFCDLSLNTFSASPLRFASDSMRDRFQLAGRTLKMYNVHHKNDIRYTMQLCRWVLKPIGMWHPIYGHPSQNEKFISIILIIMCFSALCFVLIPAGFYTLFREKDINIKVKLFGPVGFCLTNTIKYCYFGARAAAFGRCIRHVEDDWRIVQHQTREIMLKKVVIGRRLTTLCAIFLYTGGLSYHIIMPLSSRQKINENLTIRMHTYPGYDMFFDPGASPAYEIVFCIHCLFAMITYHITTASCSLAAIFVTHACGQIDILMLLLDDLVEGKWSKDTTVKKRLSAIAKHHVRILRFSANVEEVLREICLLELLTSTLTICLLEYYCLTEWKNSDAIAILTYFILLISFTFNVLIFCYIGELLVEQYSKIGAAAYKIDWYNLSGNKALELVLIIAMSHYPPKLTAGKFIDLSMNTFGALKSFHFMPKEHP
ncbi:OR4 protein, partial [Acromyrmex charruanus]